VAPLTWLAPLTLIRLTLALDFDLALDRALSRAVTLICALNLAFDRGRNLDRVLALARILTAVLTLALARTLEPELERSLRQLKEQLLDAAEDGEKFSKWWKANSQAWAEQLRAVMISFRDVAHSWQFSPQQREALKQYYEANLLIVDCLKSARYVTCTVREEISQQLLLPLKELGPNPDHWGDQNCPLAG